MNIKKRLEKLEAVVKTQTFSCVIIRIIVESDGTILDAIRRNANGEYVSVSEVELAEIRSSHYK